MGNKYRLKFSKTGKMKFVGHLDLLRLFQRAIKRADIPVEFSQGFNPHQLLSFALPLSIGINGLEECVDISLTSSVNEKIITDGLNSAMPTCLEITDCRSLVSGEKNCASIVEGGHYTIKFPEKINTKGIVENILKSKELIVDKRTKSGIKSTDIRIDIFHLKDISTDDETVIECILSAGSGRNLKPELLVNYIYNKLEKDFDPFTVEYTRNTLFKKDNGFFVPL